MDFHRIVNQGIWNSVGVEGIFSLVGIYRQKFLPRETHLQSVVTNSSTGNSSLESAEGLLGDTYKFMLLAQVDCCCGYSVYARKSWLPVCWYQFI